MSTPISYGYRLYLSLYIYIGHTDIGLQPAIISKPSPMMKNKMMLVLASLVLVSR
jgi:hypothetical protein